MGMVIRPTEKNTVNTRLKDSFEKKNNVREKNRYLETGRNAGNVQNMKLLRKLKTKYNIREQDMTTEESFKQTLAKALRRKIS